MHRQWYPLRLAFGDSRAPCGLGDNCMGAIVAQIMREHGFNVWFYTKLRGFEHLVHDVRVDRVFLNYDFVLDYDSPVFSHPLQDLGDRHYIDAFFEFNGIPLRYDGRAADVVRRPTRAPAYDVVLNTRSGPFSRKREWPHFGALKSMLTAASIRWFDLNELGFSYCRRSASFLALDLVERARLYVGLDTGLSHYVAGVWQKALFIQSGYSLFPNWNGYDRCEAIERRTACGPCWIGETRPGECPGGVQLCMVNIGPEEVFDRIMRTLGAR